MKQVAKRATALLLSIMLMVGIFSTMAEKVLALYDIPDVRVYDDGVVTWGKVDNVTKWELTIESYKETLSSDMRSFNIQDYADNKYGSAKKKYKTYTLYIMGYKEGTRITEKAHVSWSYDDPEAIDEPTGTPMPRPERARWEGTMLVWECPEEFIGKTVTYKISLGCYFTIWFDSPDYSWDPLLPYRLGMTTVRKVSSSFGDGHGWWDPIFITSSEETLQYDCSKIFDSKFIQKYCPNQVRDLWGVYAHIYTMGDEYDRQPSDASYVKRQSGPHALEGAKSLVPIKGTITLDSAPSVGAPVSAELTGEIVVGTELSKYLHYQWQHATSPNGSFEDIDGACGSIINNGQLDLAYVPQDWDVGDWIRLKIGFGKKNVPGVNDAGYNEELGRKGVLFSEPLEVGKGQNHKVPSDPVFARFSNTVYLTNIKTDQEYYISSSPRSAKDLANIKTWQIQPTTIADVCVSNDFYFQYGSRYYVYTRFKETSTHLAGTVYRWDEIWYGDDYTVNDLILNYSNLNRSDSEYPRIGDVLKVDISSRPQAPAFIGIRGDHLDISKGAAYAGLFEDEACTKPLSSDSFYKTIYAKLMKTTDTGVGPIQFVALLYDDDISGVTVPHSFYAGTTWNAIFGYSREIYVANADGMSSLHYVDIPDFTVVAGVRSHLSSVSLTPSNSLDDILYVYSECSNAVSSGYGDVSEDNAPALTFNVDGNGNISMQVDATNSLPGIYEIYLYLRGEKVSEIITVTVEPKKVPAEDFDFVDTLIFVDRDSTVDLDDYIQPYPTDASLSPSEYTITCDQTLTSDIGSFSHINTLYIAKNAPIGTQLTFTATWKGITRQVTVEISRNENEPIITADLPKALYVSDGESVTLSVEAEGQNLSYLWGEAHMGNMNKQPSYTFTASGEFSSASTTSRLGYIEKYCTVTSTIGDAEYNLRSEITKIFVSHPSLAAKPSLVSAPRGENDETTLSWSADYDQDLYSWQVWRSKYMKGEYEFVTAYTPESLTANLPSEDADGNTYWYMLRACRKEEKVDASNNTRTFYYFSPFSEPVQAIKDSQSVPKILDVDGTYATVDAGSMVSFSVVTSTDAKYLTLYSESGNKIYTWSGSSNYKDNSGFRVWTVKWKASGNAKRTLAFRASADGINYSLKKDVSVTVKGPALSIRYSEKTIRVGESFTFTAQNAEGLKITWRVGNTGVASVTQSGKVIAKFANNTYLYAKAEDGQEVKCLLKLIAAAPLNLNATDKALSSGQTFKLLASNAEGMTVKYTSGNYKVATVDNTGNVTAKGAGNTYITVEASDGRRARCLIRVSGLSINFTEKTLAVGENYQFSVSGNNGQKVTWSTGNTTVATVDSNGKVTAKSVGNTYLYAKTPDGSQAKCLIKVTYPTLRLDYSEKTLYINQSFTFKLTGTSGQKITWSVGNTTVATVNSSGKVSAKSVGNTYLYARSADGREAKCLLKIVDPGKLGINYTEKTIYLGQSFVFTAKNAGILTPVWSVGNTSIAKVDENGKVTALSVGNTYLYAKTEDGRSAKCLIKVVDPGPLNITYTEKTIKVNQTFQFICKNPAGQDVTWSVGNTSVATVDTNGRVTGVSVGNTYLYAKTSDGRTAKCLLKIVA